MEDHTHPFSDSPFHGTEARFVLSVDASKVFVTRKHMAEEHVSINPEIEGTKLFDLDGLLRRSTLPAVALPIVCCTVIIDE